MIRKLKYVFLAMLVLMAVQLRAQLQFELSVSAKQIGKRDELQVQYLISGSDRISDFQPPYFKDWTVVSGPVISTSNYTVNGKNSASGSYTYVISPMKSGKLTIPATSVVVDGKSISCKPVTVSVRDQPHVAGVPVPAGTQTATAMSMNESGDEDYKEYMLSPGEDPIEKIRSNLLVKAVPSKKRCFVGEPVLVSYKLYTRLRSNSRVVKQPGFSGCSVSEMTTSDIQPETEVLNGKKYTSYLFRKVQLFPLQPGVITVGQASVDNTVTFISNSSDLRKLYYGMQAGEEFNLSLSTEPFTIEVMPLPGTGKRAAAVGSFEISAALKKDTIAANETNTLVVTIAGTGNFKSVSEPEIRWPAELYHFDAIEKDEIDRLSFPLSGKKVYEIPFEAHQTGRISLSAVALSFFDPVKGEYRTVRSQPLNLMVTPAVKQAFQQSAAAVSEGWDIRYLFYLLPLIFLGGAVALWFKSRHRAQPVMAAVSNEEPAVRKAVNPFERINELRMLQDDTQFYSHARELARQMIRNGQGNSDVLMQVAEDCNTVLYTPIASTSRKEILEKLEAAFT